MPTLAELVELSRTELQAVAKEYGVKANQTSAAILAELTEVLSKSTAVAEDAALEPEALHAFACTCMARGLRRRIGKGSAGLCS